MRTKSLSSSSFVANNQTKMVRLAELLIPEERVISDASTAVVEREIVLRALARLTSRERLVLVLRFYLDLSELEIAAQLKIAPGTVKSAASRALGKLRCDAELLAERVS